VTDDRCDLLCLDLEVAERVRAALIDEPAARLLAERAAALADPTRLRIAAALAGADELCVCDLAWVSRRSDKLVSHHLRVLRGAGLAESRRSGKIVFYRLTALGHRMLDATLGVREVAV
jgi:ArsR family transcriptional regulator, lead/cadmium/zinc/bismuth-responsive transcriptional repressor